MTPQIQPKLWSPEQLEFIAWLALPERDRKPRFQRDVACHLGVHESTLSEWKRLPGFGDAVLALTLELVKSSDIARIVQAQVAAAVVGDLQAARFVLDFIGWGEDGGRSVPELPDARSGAGASATAIALNVTLNDEDVAADVAKRVAARKLLDANTVLDAEPEKTGL